MAEKIETTEDIDALAEDLTARRLRLPTQTVLAMAARIVELKEELKKHKLNSDVLVELIGQGLEEWDGVDRVTEGMIRVGMVPQGWTLDRVWVNRASTTYEVGEDKVEPVVQATVVVPEFGFPEWVEGEHWEYTGEPGNLHWVMVAGPPGESCFCLPLWACEGKPEIDPYKGFGCG